MNKARRILLATTASLALIFTGAAGAQEGTAAARQPGAAAVATLTDSTTPATMTTIMQNYNTQASKDLKSLAAGFDKDLPTGTSPIVYIDWDKVATWFGTPEGPRTVNQAIGDYIKAVTGRRPDAQTLALLAKTMDNEGSEGGVIAKKGVDLFTLVVPQYPGTSFDSFYASSFRIGGVDLLAGKTASIGLSTKEFADFVNAHETWHSFDFRYVRDTGDGVEGAVKQNRAEMFADIGGVAESIRNGADLSLIDKVVALRSTWAYLAGPALAKTPEESSDHYNSIVYTTQGGLLALKARIQEMGIDNFRKLDRDQVRALDYKITDAHCLTYSQAEGLQSYYTGGAPGDAAPLVAQFRANAAAHLRAATPAELAARQAAATAAAANGGLTTEQALFAGLKTRAGELGGAASLADQLKARAEMTDSLRGKLANPATERVAEAQLQLLLYSNPHLVPRK